MAQTIPSAWAPTDPEVARVFWEGEDVSPPTFGAEGVPVIGPALASVVRFFTGPLLVPWRHWLAPLMVWTGYISAYLLTAFCLVTLFQRSWEQDEHLNFPSRTFRWSFDRAGESRSRESRLLPGPRGLGGPGRGGGL